MELLVAHLPAARLRAARVHAGNGGGGGAGAVEEEARQHLLRSRAERDAVWVLAQAVRQRPTRAALEAGLVRRWLSRYPFGGRAGVGSLVKANGRGGGIWARTSMQVRRSAVARLRTDPPDDDALARILQWLGEDPEGRAELRKYGLLGWAQDGEEEEWGEEELEKAMLGELQRRIRGGPGDEDEAALRRRRRQAMVLSEGGMPISVENIYEV